MIPPADLVARRDSAIELRRRQAATKLVCIIVLAWTLFSLATQWTVVGVPKIGVPINVLAALAYAFALGMVWQRHLHIANVVLLVAGAIHILSLYLFGAGSASAVHRWYMTFMVLPFLLLGPRYWRQCAIGAVVALALMGVLELSMDGVREGRGLLSDVLRWTGLFDDVGAGARQLAFHESHIPVARAGNLFAPAISVLVILYVFLRELRRAEAEADRLLLNVLPRTVALRLQNDANPSAGEHDDISVMFVGVVGVSDLAATMDPADVVAMLDRVFSAFDDIVDEHGLEKIKTIGAIYVVAAGAPEPHDDHAAAIAAAAMQMRDAVRALHEAEGWQLQIRAGINSGSVVAGIIGKRKYVYDLWGDTVNVAARLESHGVIGKIQISDATRLRLGDRFAAEARGHVHIKGKGSLPTFLLRDSA